ncbi:MAG: insulinase family protein [Desulfobacteraceae bacterium]|nr:insulinase family protein [Desulfobacteraceae bacterium]MCB9494812.1 insulinase family protein [Desulfobacteraceae bacterium]
MKLSGQCRTIHLNPKTKSNFIDVGQQIHKTTLSNKIRIISHKIPYIRSITMGIWIDAGSRDEEPFEHGRAHFMEHMLFKGTHKRSAFELAKAIDAIGGNSNAFTSVESTCLFAQVMDENFEKMSEILTDVFLNSKFDPEEIEHEKQVIFQEIEMFEENPEDFVMTLLDSRRWQNHSIGRNILGSRSTISSINSKELKLFFEKHYTPEKITIALAGNIDHDEAVNILGKSFEKIKSAKYETEKRQKPNAEKGLVFQKKPIEQYHLCIGTDGFSKKNRNRFKASLFTTILGGNMSSRLFQEIREKRGLAYSIYTFFNQFSDTGMIGVYEAVSEENLIPSLKLILKEVKKLKNKKYSEGELESVRSFTKGNLLLSMESTENLMVKLAQNESLYKRYIPFEETISEIEKITWNDIRDMAARVFDRSTVTASVLGPDTSKKNEISEILKI